MNLPSYKPVASKVVFQELQMNLPFGKTSNYLTSGVVSGLRPTVAIGAAVATSVLLLQFTN